MELEELKDGFYKTKVKVTQEEAIRIEQDTREQSACDTWERERKVQATESTMGSLLKMRSTAKEEEILYSCFKGSQATQYGTLMEETSRHEDKTYQERRGHSLTTIWTGLVISVNHSWLAASPDDGIFGPTASPQKGLAEYKNPYSGRRHSMKPGVLHHHFDWRRKERGTD